MPVSHALPLRHRALPGGGTDPARSGARTHGGLSPARDGPDRPAASIRSKETMGTFHVSVGDRATFSKTVGETDVYLFAGITGDFSGNHVNEEYMRRSAY